MKALLNKRAVAFSAPLGWALAASAGILVGLSFRQSLSWLGGAGQTAASASYRSTASVGQSVAGPIAAGTTLALRGGFIQAFPAATVPNTVVISGAGNGCLTNTLGTVCLDVPAGAFSALVQVTASFPAGFPTLTSPMGSLSGTSFGVDTAESPALPLLKPVSYTFTYTSLALAQVQDESRLRAACHMPQQGGWILLDSSVDTAANVLTVQTACPGILQLVEVLPAASVSEPSVYPNPLRFDRGQTEMTFSNLPAGAQGRLFTPAGELVREIQADATGRATWNGLNGDGDKAASGVYFLFLSHNGQKATIKVAVER